jgi:dihydroxyacid dehydratase/phosphogluconate dehydratase
MMLTQNMTDRAVIDVAAVKNRMISVRGETVLLDRDVAALYGVETKHVNQGG